MLPLHSTERVNTSEEKLGFGILFSLCSFLSLAFMGVFAKVASTEASTAVMVFAQNGVSVLLILPVVCYQGIAALKTQHLGLHFLRAITGSAAWYCLFLTIPIISLTNATLLLYSAPLWMPILGLCFKEKAARTVWLGVCVG